MVRPGVLFAAMEATGMEIVGAAVEFTEGRKDGQDGQ